MNTRHPFRTHAFAALLTGATLAPLVVATAQPALALNRRVVVADDGHTLSVWEKRPASPRGAILLLHGRTWGALPNFDLHVVGERVSLMDALVARGYAVYALDQRGHGATPRDRTGWLTPHRAEMDAAEVLDWITHLDPRIAAPARPALLGYSRGSMTALLTAQRHPDKVSALVLYAFPFDVSVTHAPVAEPASPPRTATTAAAAGEDFITPAATPAGVKEAYVRAALKSDPVRVDWRQEEQFDVLDPAAVHTPTLLINGDRDPYARDAALPAFFSRLATVDRWWVVMTNADHAAHLERQSAFVQAVTSFLERAGTARR